MRCSSSPANMKTPRPSFSNHPAFTYSCASAAEIPRPASFAVSRGAPRGKVVCRVLIRFISIDQVRLDLWRRFQTDASTMFEICNIDQACLDEYHKFQTKHPSRFPEKSCWMPNRTPKKHMVRRSARGRRFWRRCCIAGFLTLQAMWFLGPCHRYSTTRKGDQSHARRIISCCNAHSDLQRNLLAILR